MLPKSNTILPLPWFKRGKCYANWNFDRCCLSWLPAYISNEKVTKCWPNLKRYGLAYSSLSLMQPLDMHFVSFQTCKKDDFCLIFRAIVHKHFPYSNKTTTHAPSRLVTCAECGHTATSFVKKKNDPGKMFDMAAVTNAAATVRSTSLVGLFLLSECAWSTRVTPLLSHVRS